MARRTALGLLVAAAVTAAVYADTALRAPSSATAATNVPAVAVPPGAGTVSTRRPNHVIGRGTPAGCTSAAVVQAVAEGGVITFDCGPEPLTIVMTRTATVPKTDHLVVLDGGGVITLSGAGSRRILYSDTCAGSWSTDDCVNQPYPQIVVQNITFEDGYAGAQQARCTANIPRCWFGGVDGGGAIYAEGGQFKAVDSRFLRNRCYPAGPDLGGGAIRALAQYQNRPVYITGDTFRDGSCSNGGALSSISVQWDVINSEFIGNRALGWGANPAAAGTSGGGSGGAIYADGRDDDLLIAGSSMLDNTAREGGGAVFDVVDSGWGKLTFSQSLLQDNTSGEFQTYPGVYYSLDGHDRVPTVVSSTDR